MALDQLQYWGVSADQADAVEKWESLVREETDKRSLSWQRGEKIKSLVNENYGSIDIDCMINILSAYPLQRPVQDLGQFSESCEQLYGLNGPIGDKKLASIFSAVFDTEELTAWAAVGAEPAQSGVYWPFNLPDYLELFESRNLKEAVPEIKASDGKVCKQTD